MAERKAFLLRISPELWESLEQWAADELRSVNGQIEFVLVRAVRDAGRGKKRRSRGGTPDRDAPPRDQP